MLLCRGQPELQARSAATTHLRKMTGCQQAHRPYAYWSSPGQPCQSQELHSKHTAPTSMSLHPSSRFMTALFAILGHPGSFALRPDHTSRASDP